MKTRRLQIALLILCPLLHPYAPLRAESEFIPLNTDTPDVVTQAVADFLEQATTSGEIAEYGIHNRRTLTREERRLLHERYVELEEASILAKAPTPFAITNLETAVRAVREIRALWPERRQEYSGTFTHIVKQLRKNEADPAARDATRQFFQDVIALPTMYEDRLDTLPPDALLERKADMVKYFFSFQEIRSSPERWLELAKLIGQLKGEIHPLGDPPEWPYGVVGLTDEERQKMVPAADRFLALSNYQTALGNTVMVLTSTLMSSMRWGTPWSTGVKLFDDDARHMEFLEKLVELAQLPKEKAMELGVGITDLETAVRAVREIRALWPEHVEEYSGAFAHIVRQLSQDEADPAAREAMRQFFHDVLALPTMYEDRLDTLPPDVLLWKKADMVQSFFYTNQYTSQEIRSNPERWLELARFIGQLKSEIHPVEDPPKHPFEIPGLTDEERYKMIPEYYRSTALSNYQVRLKNTIMVLTDYLMSSLARYALDTKFFDDDAQRKEFKEKLVKLAQLSEERAKELLEPTETDWISF